MNEKLKEEIKYYTEWVKLLTLIILADLTGTISLIRIKEPTAREQLLQLIGIFSSFVILAGFFIYMYNVYRKIKQIQS